MCSRTRIRERVPYSATHPTHQLQPKMVRRKLDRAHGSTRVGEDGAFDPSRGPGGRSVHDAVDGGRGLVRGANLLPDLDGVVVGRGRDDGAELGVRPGELGYRCCVRLFRWRVSKVMIWRAMAGEAHLPVILNYPCSVRLV